MYGYEKFTGEEGVDAEEEDFYGYGTNATPAKSVNPDTAAGASFWNTNAQERVNVSQRRTCQRIY